MQIISISSHMGGHEVIEFCSKDEKYRMGTFCLQIPDQINHNAPFEIPDEFMNKELGLTSDCNPIRWYAEKKQETKDIASESNAIFEKFMDAVAKFCDYDRRGKMEERQRWYEERYM